MTREELVALHLQKYREGCLELLALERVLENFPRETLSETIISLSQPSMALGDYVHNGGKIDPVPYAAMAFRQANEERNRLGREELLHEIEQLRGGLGLVKRCVAQLEERRRRIVERLYFQGMTWEQVEDAEGFTRSTLQYHRRRAIKELARMPEYVYSRWAIESSA